MNTLFRTIGLSWLIVLAAGQRDATCQDLRTLVFGYQYGEFAVVDAARPGFTALGCELSQRFEVVGAVPLASAGVVVAEVFTGEPYGPIVAVVNLRGNTVEYVWPRAAGEKAPRCCGTGGKPTAVQRTRALEVGKNCVWLRVSKLDRATVYGAFSDSLTAAEYWRRFHGAIAATAEITVAKLDAANVTWTLPDRVDLAELAPFPGRVGEFETLWERHYSGASPTMGAPPEWKSKAQFIADSKDGIVRGLVAAGAFRVEDWQPRAPEGRAQRGDEVLLIDYPWVVVRHRGRLIVVREAGAELEVSCSIDADEPRSWLLQPTAVAVVPQSPPPGPAAH